MTAKTEETKQAEQTEETEQAEQALKTEPTEQPNQPNTQKPSRPPDLNQILNMIEPWHIAIMISFIGILGISMTWVWADDFTSPYSGTGILMHFPNAPDKWFMIRTTPLGSMISVAAPSCIIISVLTTSIVLLVQRKITRELMGVLAMTMMSIIVLLWGCKEILDPDLARIGPFNTPGSGLVIIILSCITIAVAYFYQEKKISMPQITKRFNRKPAEPTSDPEKS